MHTSIFQIFALVAATVALPLSDLVKERGCQGLEKGSSCVWVWDV
jgi:hypothetical protein